MRGIRLDEDTIQLAASRYGATVEQLLPRDGSMNVVFEYQQDERSCILRFTPSEHRSVNQVRGEIDWLVFLGDHGLAVSSPISSDYGNLVEVVESETGRFSVTAFHKAKGDFIGYPACLNNASLYQQLGTAIGRLHALSKRYHPNDAAIRRHEWKQNYYLENIEKYLPEDEWWIRDCVQQLIDELQAIPKDSSSYGLIHGDINVNNFVVTENGITLFDFDEAQYSWFVEDIIPPLYYLLYVHGGEEGKKARESQAKVFMDYFLPAYSEESLFQQGWNKMIPVMLRLREIIVYVGMHKHNDVDQLDQWGLDFLRESKERIRERIPIVNMWT